MPSKSWYEQNKERHAAVTKAWRLANKERMRELQNEWRKKHPERVAVIARNCHLKFQYGLQPDDYEAILSAQGGGCAICGVPPVTGKYLSVDHDHETNEVRALLCPKCNIGLGQFNDNPDTLIRAAAYLAMYRISKVK